MNSFGLNASGLGKRHPKTVGSALAVVGINIHRTGGKHLRWHHKHKANTPITSQRRKKSLMATTGCVHDHHLSVFLYLYNRIWTERCIYPRTHAHE